MPRVEELRDKIDTAESLKSVVSTMKTLAAVNERQFEVMVEAIGEYNRTVEMGLQVLLQDRPVRELRTGAEPGPRGPAAQGRLAAIVVGSDQGMCGPFSQRIVEHALSEIGRLPYEPESISLLVLGARAVAEIESSGWEITDYLPVPVSVEGVSDCVEDVFVRINAWEFEPGVDSIMMFYNEVAGATSYDQRTVRVSPVSMSWLRSLQQREWESRCLPMYRADFEELFSSLVREYVFITVYRGIAGSAAAENSSRLQSMQAAENNIEERLGELNTQYQIQRQTEITEEVLDVISGFEAMTADDESGRPGR